MMMPATCNQVSVSTPPLSRKNSFSKDSEKALDGGSNHSHSSNASLSKKSKRKSSHSNQQQPTAAIPFPWKLHRILDDADAKGFNDIISWVPSENGFKVHKTKQFDEEIMPKYFDKTKYKSFQRQLNMWGFDRVGSGPYKGAYLHEFFVRGQPKLCESMQRTKIKGIHSKKLRKNILNDPLGGGSSHSLGGGSSHSLRGLSNHSLGLSRHSSTGSVRDVRASIEASAQKLADLERQKEEIQRKLELVSTKANAAAVSDALNNMTSSSSSGRMVTPHGSLHSRSERSSFEDDFQPLPLSGGDSLVFGGHNFFFAGDEQETPQRRRPARRFSLELKTENSDEYVLRELPDFFGDEVGSSGNSQNNFDMNKMSADSMLSPTPLPPNLDVVTATSDINGNHNSSLVIGLDRPTRRFSFLSTPVQNPYEKSTQSKPPRQSLARSRMNMNYIKNNLMNNINMNMNMNIMKNNMMNMHLNNQNSNISLSNF